MGKDLVFIHPGNHKKTYQSLANEYTAIAPPVWTLLLADFIKREEYSVAVYDANVEGWTEDTANDILVKHDPELIVIMVYGHNPSASTQTMPAASHVVTDIKKINPEVPIAMGGLHPTALPEQTLNQEQVDFIIKGEGAYPIKKLLDCLTGKCSLKSVRGICYKDSKANIVHTQPADPIENLDEAFQSYAWDLLPPLSYYRAHNSHTIQYFEQSQRNDFADVRSPYAVLYTSLGCPYNCSYCCINALFGKKKIRYWSLNTVIRWIDELVSRYQVKHIRLDDELFVLDAQRVERFCDVLIERNYDLNLWAYSRVDTVKPGLLAKMQKAGFNWLCLGIEAANKNVMQNVKKNIRHDISEVVRMIQDNGIHVLGNYMFGLPEDNLDSMTATLDLALELNCEFANFYCTVAYPGSKLYEYWQHKNPGVLPESWNGFSQHSYDTHPLPTRYLAPPQVLQFRDSAFDSYFTNEKYLKTIELKFGARALDHIKRMTDVKLQRKLLMN